ncbi:hypothetical protein AGMMS49944_32090 [Spirochaetia bacterium]|nr:hypothetical protein AGMMS49944_32090 [Spirochaetia bacterium]
MCHGSKISKERFFIVQEILEGEIIHKYVGTNGFDSIFYLSYKKCTLAELEEYDKNQISHRGKAIMAISKFLS